MTRAAVGLGGNVGRPEEAFRRAIAAMETAPGTRVLAVSGLWRSEPWGLRDQPEFLNAAALLETDEAPAALLDRLRTIERRAGREPGVRWGPRALDLDLLFHGDARIDGPDLALPHPRIAERTFVLEPLAEIVPDWIHPGHGKRCVELLADLRASGRATACRRTGELLEAAGSWR